MKTALFSFQCLTFHIISYSIVDIRVHHSIAIVDNAEIPGCACPKAYSAALWCDKERQNPNLFFSCDDVLLTSELRVSVRTRIMHCKREKESRTNLPFSFFLSRPGLHLISRQAGTQKHIFFLSCTRTAMYSYVRTYVQRQVGRTQ